MTAVKTYLAVANAINNLPAGWAIFVSLLKNDWVITLLAPSGKVVQLPLDGKTLKDSIDLAVTYAIQHNQCERLVF